MPPLGSRPGYASQSRLRSSKTKDAGCYPGSVISLSPGRCPSALFIARSPGDLDTSPDGESLMEAIQSRIWALVREGDHPRGCKSSVRPGLRAIEDLMVQTLISETAQRK